MKELIVELPKNGFRYCDIHRSICRFYLREDSIFYRKERHYGTCPLPMAVKEWYTTQVLEDAEMLMRFSLAAAVGEARHYGKTFGHAPDVEFEKIKVAHDRIKKALGVANGLSWESSYFRESYKSRDFIYSCWIPVPLWDYIIKRLKFIFKPEFWGQSPSFGGGSWQRIVTGIEQ